MLRATFAKCEFASLLFCLLGKLTEESRVTSCISCPGPGLIILQPWESSLIPHYDLGFLSEQAGCAAPPVSWCRCGLQDFCTGSAVTAALLETDHSECAVALAWTNGLRWIWKMWENGKSINPFSKDICVFSVFQVKETVKREYLSRTQWEPVKQVYSLKWDAKSLRKKFHLPPHGWNSH